MKEFNEIKFIVRLFICIFGFFFLLFSITAWNIEGIDKVTYVDFVINGWKNIVYFFSRLF